MRWPWIKKGNEELPKDARRKSLELTTAICLRLVENAALEVELWTTGRFK